MNGHQIHKRLAIQIQNQKSFKYSQCRLHISDVNCKHCCISELTLINIQKYSSWKLNLCKKKHFLEYLFNVWSVLFDYNLSAQTSHGQSDSAYNKNKAKIIFLVCQLITEASLMNSGGVKYHYLMMKWNIQYNTTVGFIHIKVHINICTFWTNTGRLSEIIFIY